MKNQSSSSLEIGIPKQIIRSQDRIADALTHLKYRDDDLVFNDQVFQSDHISTFSSISNSNKYSSESNSKGLNRCNRIVKDSSDLSSIVTKSTSSKQRKHKRKEFPGIDAADNAMKKICDNFKSGLPGNQLESSKLRRTSSEGSCLNFQESELLSISKAFLIDIFQVQFNNSDLASYMEYVKINVTNVEQESRRPLFSMNDFAHIIQQDSFISKMNRFITEERNKWLTYWNNVLIGRRCYVLQASMDNIKFDVTGSMSMCGMVGDSGIGKRIFSVANMYVFFCYKTVLL